MSNFSELSLTRQSCRNFSDKRVEREKMIKCVETARLSPSACNSQPWSVVAVINDDLVAEIGKATQPIGMNPTMTSAKAFFVITEEFALLMPKIRCALDSQYFAQGDIGAFAASLCYEATEQGLASCIIGVFDRERLWELLDLPREKRIRLLVAVGYPADETIRDKVRKPMENFFRIVE